MNNKCRWNVGTPEQRVNCGKPISVRRKGEGYCRDHDPVAPALNLQVGDRLIDQLNLTIMVVTKLYKSYRGRAYFAYWRPCCRPGGDWSGRAPVDRAERLRWKKLDPNDCAVAQCPCVSCRDPKYSERKKR